MVVGYALPKELVMSFAVEFHAWRHDGTMERGINPFTKQPVDIPRERLSAQEAAAVLDVVERASARHPGHFGPGRHPETGLYSLLFEDGAGAEIDVETVERSCTFRLGGRGVTPLLAQMLFDVMVAGNWELTWEDSLIAVVPTAECAEAVRVRYEGLDDFEVVLATSPQDVARVLSPRFDEWRRYRDAVAGES
jgi:hypothetical protein